MLHHDLGKKTPLQKNIKHIHTEFFQSFKLQRGGGWITIFKFNEKFFCIKKPTPYLGQLIKEGGAGILNGRNIVITIIPNIARCAVEMWMVAAE